MILPAVGGLLLVLLGIDVFGTVFSSGGRGGPVNRRQNQLIWALFRLVSRGREQERRTPLLSMAGSILVVSTLAVWVVWLVVAFALVYYPWMGTFLVSPGELRAPLLEALYYSGYTAATLGLGDVVPDASVLRLLTLLEAFGGFALLSTAVTYFLAVYREVIAKEALATTIADRVAAADGDLSRLTGEGEGEALARWCESVAQKLAQVLMGHHQYPVLHYFRSRSEYRSLPVQLGHLLRLRRDVRAASATGAGDDASALLRHGGYRHLEQTLPRYLREVEALFIPPRSDTGLAGDESTVAGDDPVERAHRRMLHYMLYD